MSLSVDLGLLSRAEFDALTPEDRTTFEAETRRLQVRYGDAWLRRERTRLRAEFDEFIGLPVVKQGT